MDWTIRGKTALVTGAAKRLGRAIAVGLASRGVNVVIHYGASADEAKALCADLRATGVQAWAVGADLADPAAAEGLMDRGLAAAGPVDILVNSASVFPESTLADVTLDQLHESVAVNAWAPLALTRAFAAQGLPGRVINLLDTRVWGHDPTHTAYILSKHLLTAATRMAALEYAPLLTVNGVAPGLILPPPWRDPEALCRMAEVLPLKRRGYPEDVVQTVLFLADSNYITGQVIFVDGGAHLHV